MQTSRDSSIWRSLAVAFGDGLAFGVGMTLTQPAASRPSAALAPEANPAPLADRLQWIERRLAEIEQKPAAVPAPAFDQKVLEAVVNALDVRLKEQASHVERRLAEIESNFTAELKTLRQQDQAIASTVEAHLGNLQDHFNEKLEGVRGEVERDCAALRQSMHEELALAVKTTSDAAIQQSLEPIRTEAAQKDNQIAQLRQRIEESDSAMLELLNGIGDLVRQAAERRTATQPPPGAATPAPEPQPAAAPSDPAPSQDTVTHADELEPEVALPALAQAAKPNRLWRVPLVSSLMVAGSACCLMMMHYW
jgi:hypothetical protein